MNEPAPIREQLYHLSDHEFGTILRAIGAAVADGSVCFLADSRWKHAESKFQVRPSTAAFETLRIARALGLTIGVYRRGIYIHVIADPRRLRRMKRENRSR